MYLLLVRELAETDINIPVVSESKTVISFVEYDTTENVALLADDDGVLNPEFTVTWIVDDEEIEEDTFTVITYPLAEHVNPERVTSPLIEQVKVPVVIETSEGRVILI